MNRKSSQKGERFYRRHVSAVHRSTLASEEVLKLQDSPWEDPQPGNRNLGSFEQNHRAVITRKPGHCYPTRPPAGDPRPRPELWGQEGRHEARLPHTVRLRSQSGGRTEPRISFKNEDRKPRFHRFYPAAKHYQWYLPFPQKTTKCLHANI